MFLITFILKTQLNKTRSVYPCDLSYDNFSLYWLCNCHIDSKSLLKLQTWSPSSVYWLVMLSLLTYFFWWKAGIHTCPVRSLRYGWWAYALGERTRPRLKENSKIFCIDGNLASGKGALAQKLADRLGRWCYWTRFWSCFCSPLSSCNSSAA